MKKYTKVSMFVPLSLLTGSVFMVSCDNEKVSDLSDLLSLPKSNCSTYNTQSQSDAENSVVRLGNDYRFNLYWMGNSSKISVWENNGIHDYYELKFDPLTVVVLGTNGAATDTFNCKENKENASKCIERLETILAMTKDARHSQAAVGGKLSIGKEMTFKCVDEFAHKKIEELKAFRTAARS